MWPQQRFVVIYISGESRHSQNSSHLKSMKVIRKFFGPEARKICA